MDARLTVISGPLVGQSIPLRKGKFLIGREPDCHCLLDDLAVSRHHCVLILDDWTLRVRDLNSKNGTIVNGSRIRTWEVVLSDRDVISVGPWTARVATEAGNPAATTPEVDGDRVTELSTGDTTQFGGPVPQPSYPREADT